MEISSDQSCLMKALRREKTGYTPVWLMRQAGRMLPEYRRVRARVSFADFCRDKDLVCEFTVKARDILGADAAIIFSDLLVVLECFGLKTEYPGKDGGGIRIACEAEGLPDSLPEAEVGNALSYVFDAIRRTRRALRKDIPLLGFAGCPFTVASYLIEGGSPRDFQKTRAFMTADPVRWQVLMERLGGALGHFLLLQIDAGAQAVQLFDTWAGCLSPEEYRRYALPHSRKLIAGLEGRAPVIHFGVKTGPFLEDFASAGGQAVGVDWRVDLDEARRRIGPDRAVQGNLAPEILLEDKPRIREAVGKILRRAGGEPGHIFNLGHGVLPETPVENAKYLVDIVHEMSQS